MPTIECEKCYKLINTEEKNFIVDDKRFFHKKCYLLYIKQQNKEKYRPKLTYFSVYFSICLFIFILLSVFQDLSNPFLVFLSYIMMVLTISFGIMIFICLIQLIRLK